MNRAIPGHALYTVSRVASWALVISAHTLLCCVCFADDGADLPPVPPIPYEMPQEFRSGGRLEASYNYHRQPPMSAAVETPTITPANGWYNYGFPVQSYRWGWFGAEHYYPHVGWHHGYYGDCCRSSYRRGY